MPWDLVAQRGNVPKSDLTRLVCRRSSQFPSPLMGEGSGGGEGSAFVPPILTFPHAGGKGLPEIVLYSVPIFCGLI